MRSDYIGVCNQVQFLLKVLLSMNCPSLDMDFCSESKCGV